MPKISVIVPVYKVEAYLNKCIDSILAQTFTDFELILVDDGSPDKCGEICDAYAKQDNRIKVIHKENGGLSDARNAGIAVANGRYISFVDSDDYIAEDMYEVLYNRIISDVSDMAVCNYLGVDENGDAVDEMNVNSPIHEEVLTGRQVLEEKLSGDRHGYWVIACCKLYKKELFDNIHFPKGKIHEDAFVAHEIYAKCARVSCVKRQLYFYLQRAESIMGMRLAEYRIATVKQFDYVEAYLERALFYAKRNLFANMEFNLNVALGEAKLLYRAKWFRTNKQAQQRSKETRKLYNKVFALALKSNMPLQRKLRLFLYYLTWGRTNVNYLHILKKCRNLYTMKKQVWRCRNKGNACVFFMATPCHGNLGDHAIVCAQKKVLAQWGYENSIVEISSAMYHKYRTDITKCVKPDDIIVIDGGGSMGTLWPLEDDKISEIIDTYKKNRIIVFPQTCYYDDSAAARERLKKNQKIYASAERLLIALRDKKSYDFCVQNFKGVSFAYTPDIVLSLAYNAAVERQDKCLICFRADCEKVLSDADEQKIYAYLKEKGIETEPVSTVCDYPVSAQMRKAELEKLWDKFAGARLVLTDRLHGMIFAAITGTPCLAMDNKSKKVSGVHAWIAKLPTVRICETAEEMLAALSAFYKISAESYDASALDAAYEPLKAFFKQ